MGAQRQVRPAHLKVPVVRQRVRDSLEAHVLVADVCGQAVDDRLQLLHSLGNPPAPQVHLGEKGAAKTVISGAGPEAPGWGHDGTGRSDQRGAA